MKLPEGSRLAPARVAVVALMRLRGVLPPRCPTPLPPSRRNGCRKPDPSRRRWRARNDHTASSLSFSTAIPSRPGFTQSFLFLFHIRQAGIDDARIAARRTPMSLSERASFLFASRT